MTLPWNRFTLKTIACGGAVIAAVFFAARANMLLPFGVLVGAVLIAAPLFRWPLLGVLGIVFFLPFERIGSIEIAGMTVRAHQMIAVLTLMSGAFHALRLPKRVALRNPFLLPLALFLFANIISLYNAVNLERSVSVLLFTTFTVAVSLMIPFLATTRNDLRKIFTALFVSAAVVSLFGLFQFVGDLAGLSPAITGLREHYTKAVFGFPRIQSTALEPLYFANYLLLPISILVALFGYPLKTEKEYGLFRPWMRGALLILFGVNFILTVARGGYIALAVILALLGVLFLRELFTPKRVLTIFGAAILIGMLAIRLLGIGGGTVNVSVFVAHVQNIFGGASYAERVENFEIAWRAFSEHPLIGIGPGAFGPYASEHPFIEPRTGWKIVNNEFLELLAETGVLGFSLFLFSAAFLCLRSLKAWRAAQDQFLKAVLLGSTAAWIGILAQYQTFSILYIMHVWVAFGLVVAVQNMILSSSQTYHSSV